MLNWFGWEVGMNLGEVFVLIAGAAVIAAVLQNVGRAGTGYEWVFTFIAALAGGWLGSEAFAEFSTWGLAMEGLYLVPALIGAVILGVLVDAAVRYIGHGSYMAPHPV
jgi:uncharacterized membrane protein YeaQ/YmgE (transglycosylase-associated protein family)